MANTIGETLIDRTARIKVPATSANLGPGYDCAGLAVGIFDELEAQLLPDGELDIQVEGEGADTVARDGSHLVIRSMARGFAEVGRQIPGVRLICRNVIPHGRGLGSSSAAIVAGLVLARELIPGSEHQLNDKRLLALATEIEGHPDNVAPAIAGGLTIAWTEDGVGRSIRIQPNPRIQPVVAIPAEPLATQRARELLPATVPHGEAAANAARAALLVPAFTTHTELLLEATTDELHQKYRRFAYPTSFALVSALRDMRIPAMISGAGPTVIALGVSDTERDRAAVEQAVAKVLAQLRGSDSQPYRVLTPAVVDHGAAPV